jgi:hypothetical protein
MIWDTWDVPLIVTGMLEALVMLVLAALVLQAAPRRRANQWLALFFATFGLGSLGPVVLMTPNAWLADNIAFYGDVLQLIFLVAYLAFVGEALDVPLARIFRRPAVILMSAGLAIIGSAYVYFHMAELNPIVARTDEGGYGFTVRGLLNDGNFLSAAVFTFTLACALSALRAAAPGTARRAQAKAYALGFGLNDAGLAVLGYLVPALGLAGVLHTPEWAGFYNCLGTLTNLVSITACVLIARGMLRYQMFGFDLKVKWTIQRGTVAAIILGAFFIAAQVAQNYLAGALGWLAGGAAAGLLLFAIKPLERFAMRLSDRAMPKTTGTPEYVAFRKLEVYKAAVESAHETGGISARERASLDRLRAKLGIGELDASAVEGDVLAGAAE